MMTAQTSPASASDADLWSQVCNDDVTAFRSVVERHQSAVSAVAFAICGEFAASEDAAQEAFLTAWRERTSLVEPSRLRSWLCGIGRNMARNIRRRQHRDTTGDQDISLIAATDHSPEQAAVSREEESLVWDNLEQIPETYREPLVLFYREAQSVAEVARSLELSEEVVRQRLSRGRAMLREQVMSIVERALIRSRPTGAFTTGVLTGVTCILGEAAAASAATATSSWGAAKTLAAGGSTGALGGLVGTLGGAAGGWFGTWCSAQMAPTGTEREYLLRMGRRLVALGLGFFVLCFLAVRFGPRPSAWQIIAVVFLFQAVTGIYCFQCWRRVKAIRRSTSPDDDPNLSPMRQRAFAIAARRRGRRYRSTWTLLGLPLLDIQVSDPVVGLQSTTSTPARQPLQARGWIAIGDDARGVLLACGQRAVGIIALGDFTFGLFSFGAIAVGGLAIGGVSLGAVSIGGLALGGLALGGLSVGWDALGGAALAFNFAMGGFAAAVHLACGGAAYARDFALGGAAWAEHANDSEAQARLMQHPGKLAMDWSVQHQFLWIAVLLVFCIGVPLLINLLRYERVPVDLSRRP